MVDSPFDKNEYLAGVTGIVSGFGAGWFALATERLYLATGLGILLALILEIVLLEYKEYEQYEEAKKQVMEYVSRE